MYFDIKNAWKSLLFLTIPCFIISVGLLFIIQDEFDIQKFSIGFLFLFTILYNILKISLLDKYIIKEKDKVLELNPFQKYKKFYQDNGKSLFFQKKPFISTPKLHFIFEITFSITLFLATIYSFYSQFSSISEYTFLSVLVNLFNSVLTFVLILSFIYFFIFKFFHMLFLLFVEPFCYQIKKVIDKDHIVYLKNDFSLYIYKNSQLHCDSFPAYIETFESTLIHKSSINLNYNYFNDKTVKSFIEDNYDNCVNEEWYLNNKKIEIDKDLPLKEKQKIIKLIQSSKNF